MFEVFPHKLKLSTLMRSQKYHVCVFFVIEKRIDRFASTLRTIVMCYRLSSLKS